MTNKTCIIFGGTSGLGLEIAKQLKTKNKVYAIGKNVEKMRQLKKDPNFKKIQFLSADLTDFQQTKNVVEEILEKENKVDLVFNSVGVHNTFDWLENNDPENLKTMVSINLLGVIYPTMVILPTLKEQNQGIIVNINSTASLKGCSQEAVYSATKYGLHGFILSLKEELKNSNVKLIEVCPGGMQTELFAKGNLNIDTSSFIQPKTVAEVILKNLEYTSETLITDFLVIRRNR